MTEDRIGPARDDLVVVEVDDSLTIYDPRSKQAATLNETAAGIWRLCDGARTLDEIEMELADRYAVAREEIREHVRATVRQFADQGLLVQG